MCGTQREKLTTPPFKKGDQVKIVDENHPNYGCITTVVEFVDDGFIYPYVHVQGGLKDASANAPGIDEVKLYNKWDDLKDQFKPGDKVLISSGKSTSSIKYDGTVATIREIKPMQFSSNGRGMEYYAMFSDIETHGIWLDELKLVTGDGNMDNLKTGDILVLKTNTDEDNLFVLGTFEHNGETRVAAFEVYDGSMDRTSVSLDNAKKDFYIKGQVPETEDLTEVTLEEVAEKMGVDVSKLRIKD